ncbi:MAG: hypothetical protein JNJ73_16810 [Hyphomonadaceae bacterium]|nr:hypothetical protein [Hyphomonadaceae bacterium]
MSSRNWIARLFTIAVLACATPFAAAQTTEDPIDVHGERPPPQRFETTVSRFVERHGTMSRIDQIGRWREPICPRVENLPPAFNRYIANRIKAVARAVDAPASNDENCTPNIRIVFTPEPQALLDRVRADAPHLLGYHFIHRRPALATVTMPVQAWYATATSNGLETIIDHPMSRPPNGTLGSRLTTGLQTVFLHILIVMDSREIADREVGPIADYLAMLSLSQMRDQGGACETLASIMDLLSDDCPGRAPPQTLSEVDIAYLSGLYTMNAENIGPLQRAHLYRRIAANLRSPSSSP